MLIQIEFFLVELSDERLYLLVEELNFVLKICLGFEQFEFVFSMLARAKPSFVVDELVLDDVVQSHLQFVGPNCSHVLRFNFFIPSYLGGILIRFVPFVDE